MIVDIALTGSVGSAGTGFSELVSNAAWLNYAQGSAQFNASYSVGGGEPDHATSVLADCHA